MLNSQVTKYAYGYLGVAPWRRRLDLLMWLAIGAVLPGAIVRLAEGGALLMVTACILGWALVGLIALRIHRRMQELVSSMPQDARAWATPGDSDTLN